MIKILFVCHGNICRSPLGEFIFKDIAIKAGFTVAGINDHDDNPDFFIASAATSREEIGNPIYPPALRTLMAHGIGTPDNELGVSKKRARQITMTDLDYYDLIICMDNNNLRNMARMFGDSALTGGSALKGDSALTGSKVHLMLEYAGRPGEEVADPWYTGNFDETWDDVSQGCQGLLEELKKHLGK